MNGNPHQIGKTRIHKGVRKWCIFKHYLHTQIFVKFSDYKLNHQSIKPSVDLRRVTRTSNIRNIAIFSLWVLKSLSSMQLDARNCICSVYWVVVVASFPSTRLAKIHCVRQRARARARARERERFRVGEGVKLGRFYVLLTEEPWFIRWARENSMVRAILTEAIFVVWMQLEPRIALTTVTTRRVSTPLAASKICVDSTRFLAAQIFYYGCYMHSARKTTR